MPVSPQITLNITLLDYSGAAIGSVASPAYVRIALCGYDPYLPAVPGTGFTGKVASWPGDIPYTGNPIVVLLWGNDVITPANTYYSISILDSKRNVIQSAPYQFVGTGTYDLSTVTPYTFPPIVPPISPTIVAGLVTIPYSATPIFDCSLVTAGVITFEITLTGNVGSSSLINAQAGQIVIISVIQDLTGGHTFSYPSNVHNTGDVESSGNGLTVQAFYARANGHLYPIGIATYN
jgi:hypothetical protein